MMASQFMEVKTMGPSRNITVYRHSFPRRLEQFCLDWGMTPAQMFGRRFDVVSLVGHGGLSYGRLFSSSDHYLQPLMDGRPDILCIDLGANDLQGANMTPAALVEQVNHFLWLLEVYRICPKVTVFLMVLKRTLLRAFPGQITDVQLYNARVDEINQLLHASAAPKFPHVQVWSQEAYNRAPFLRRCPLTNTGMLQEVKNISDMMAAMSLTVDEME